MRGSTAHFVMLLLTAGLGASTPVAAVSPSAAGVARAEDQGCPDAEERALLTTINQYRKRKGKKPLRLEAQLMRAAEHHAKDMTGMSRVVDHTLSDGISAQQNLIDFGYPADTAYWGENFAVGLDSANEAFDFWRSSRGHNRNVVKKTFRAIGIARVYDATSTYTWYWVTTFSSVLEEKSTC